MRNLYRLTIVLTLVIGTTACSGFLNPPTKQNKTVNSIKSVRDLKALINGAYDRLSQLPLYGGNYILFGDIRTPNAFVNSRALTTVALFNYLPSDGYADGPWEAAYQVIANCNLIINSAVETGSEVKQIKGAAYAVRALAHMILLRLYGEENVDGSDMGIPYITKYLGKGQNFPKRLTVKATNKKISADFEEAIQLMDPSIVSPSTRMTYYGALALAARHYMFTGEYAKAATAAKK